MCKTCEITLSTRDVFQPDELVPHDYAVSFAAQQDETLLGKPNEGSYADLVHLRLHVMDKLYHVTCIPYTILKHSSRAASRYIIKNTQHVEMLMMKAAFVAGECCTLLATNLLAYFPKLVSVSECEACTFKLADHAIRDFDADEDTLPHLRFCAQVTPFHKNTRLEVRMPSSQFHIYVDNKACLRLSEKTGGSAIVNMRAITNLVKLYLVYRYASNLCEDCIGLWLPKLNSLGRPQKFCVSCEFVLHDAVVHTHNSLVFDSYLKLKEGTKWTGREKYIELEVVMKNRTHNVTLPRKDVFARMSGTILIKDKKRAEALVREALYAKLPVALTCNKCRATPPPAAPVKKSRKKFTFDQVMERSEVLLSDGNFPLLDGKYTRRNLDLGDLNVCVWDAIDKGDATLLLKHREEFAPVMETIYGGSKEEDLRWAWRLGKLREGHDVPAITIEELDNKYFPV